MQVKSAEQMSGGLISQINCLALWLLSSPALQNLRVRDTCVSHVTVHTTAPMPARSGASTTSHRLIVSHMGIAQGHIVHAALTEAYNSILLMWASTPTTLFSSSSQTFAPPHLGG